MMQPGLRSTRKMSRRQRNPARQVHNKKIEDVPWKQTCLPVPCPRTAVGTAKMLYTYAFKTCNASNGILKSRYVTASKWKDRFVVHNIFVGLTQYLHFLRSVPNPRRIHWSTFAISKKEYDVKSLPFEEYS